MTGQARAASEHLREMALTLLDLADAMDCEAADGGPAPRDAICSAKTIGRLAPLLANVARIESRARLSRSEYFSKVLFGEPAWDMLLDLFVQTVEGRRVSVTSLCAASSAPLSTALRYVSEMEAQGVIVREKSQFDQRTSFLSLSNEAYRRIGSYLHNRAAMFRWNVGSNAAESSLIIDRSGD